MGAGGEMEYLREHYGNAYDFAARDGMFTARARFGENDVLEDDNPAGLLLLVRTHYRYHAGRGSVPAAGPPDARRR